MNLSWMKDWVGELKFFLWFPVCRVVGYCISGWDTHALYVSLVVGLLINITSAAVQFFQIADNKDAYKHVILWRRDEIFLKHGLLWLLASEMLQDIRQGLGLLFFLALNLVWVLAFEVFYAVTFSVRMKEMAGFWVEDSLLAIIVRVLCFGALGDGREFSVE